MIDAGTKVTFNWCEGMQIKVPKEYDGMPAEVLVSEPDSSYVTFNIGVWCKFWIENVYLTPETK